jgi:hypothetical protein
MLTILCILAVANMALACSDTNKVWWLNMLAGLVVVAQIAHLA